MASAKYPAIIAFDQSPDDGQGLAHDMRVRLALEEAVQPDNIRLVAFAAMVLTSVSQDEADCPYESDRRDSFLRTAVPACAFGRPYCALTNRAGWRVNIKESLCNPICYQPGGACPRPRP